MADLIWKVGGAQGEGIDSTGDIVASTLNRNGHYVFAYRSFMSLIKGGHTSYKVRIADAPVHYQGDDLDILIAFDQLTIDTDGPELRAGGVIVADAGRWQPRPPEGQSVHLLQVPMTEVAKELAGNPVMKNMVAVGVSAALLGLDPDPFYRQVEERFGKKGAQVVELNRDLIARGYQYARAQGEAVPRLRLPAPAGRGHYLMSGNEAVGLGALVGGCRFLAAYPITPATEIMYWLLANLPRYGGKIIQAEDEIAACTMAIGAAYAGARAMTTTSSPGFSLMAEALGLAAIAEVPLVVVDVQRAGPATGLPTKTEQSNLNAQLYNSHGDAPRIVLAPTTVEECIYFTAEAHNLAEIYQCPVIISTDLYLGASRQSLPGVRLDRIRVDRGKLQDDAALAGLARDAFHRYENTPDGVSPRSLPGQRGGEYTALSNEHDARGRIEIEDPDTRVVQMDKRERKLASLAAAVEEWGWSYTGPERPDLLLVGFGSTRAQIAEATAALGEGVGHLQIRALRPFPARAVGEHLARCRRALVVENNQSGQLQGLIARLCGGGARLHGCRKYDGDPFTVREIVERARVLLDTAADPDGGVADALAPLGRS